MSSTHAKAMFATLLTLVVLAIVPIAPAYATYGEFALASEIAVQGTNEEVVAVDESTDDFYVYTHEESGVIYKYDAEGNPVDFSALGTNEIAGVGSYGDGEAELAVDNSLGPAKGDIYLTAPEESATGGEIKVYGADGKQVGNLSKVNGRPWGEACGVAVDGSGNVYVGLYPETVDMFTPTGNPVDNSDYVGSRGGFSEICHVAADGEGRVYAAAWIAGRIVRVDSFFAGGADLLLSNALGAVATSNAESAEVFVISGGIRQYNSSGDLLSTFGESSGYIGMTFNAKDGRLYVLPQNGTSKVDVWQGVVLPAVRTLGSSGASPAGSVTLNGSVNPEEATIESCSFQYGSTEAYGSEVSCAQSTPLTGTGVLPVSAGLTGLTLNHAYHYRLSASDSHATINGSDQTFTILVEPSVEDQQPSASEITRSTAVLSGAVNPQEGETGFHFEYGPTEAYGNVTSTVRSGDMVSSDVPITQEIVGLIPNTLYHYRLVATNVAGTTYGADHTFTSGEPALPMAITGTATEIAQNTATITGAVDTNGLPTSYGFEIATSTDYGPPTGLGYIGAGADGAPASLKLTGLQPGTTYHYRLTASNVDGTSYGADHTFTTGVYASTFAEPPAPLPFVAVPQIVFPTETEAAPPKKAAKKKTTKKKIKRKAKKRSKHAAKKKK